MKTLDYSYLNIPVSVVKERLLKACKKHKETEFPLSVYPPIVEYIAQRQWYKVIMYRMAQCQFEFIGEEGDFFNYFGPLVYNEMHQIIPEAAAYNWLCLEGDKDRLDLLYPKDKGVKNEFSYGLVLRYYQPVMRMACFISGLTYEEEREGIPGEVLNDAFQTSVSATYKMLRNIPALKYKKFCQDDIYEQVRSMTF